MKKYNIAVVGATGMVGNKFLKVLSEKNLPVENYYLYASAKSAGKVVSFMGKDLTVIELKRENITDKKIDIALFSAGASVSRDFAPIFVEAGAVVIDNSSCFRMDKDVPLVVPEVNPQDISLHNGIIANPNCSTIQAVVALKPLNDKYKIKRIVYSTYQSVSGAGVGGYTDLEEGVKGNAPKKFPYPIFNNLIPQIDVFLDDGYTKEEKKMIDETRKILHEKDLKITATTVRVPVFYGHSESINVEFYNPCTLDGIKDAIKGQQGIVFYDNISKNIYPMPCVCEDKDEVFVGRIRLDDSVDYGCNIFVVADNIRKGAATNAVQIAEYIIKNGIKTSR
ncbi:MAG: aspartate-semialdehyde dehydrogenase [Clostridiales bacterium]|jgi:aspartate-semialdehyde dehydrogenase|nr:aspartate-semialdehyde dehydrogenase [Clostridiales bacterium]